MVSDVLRLRDVRDGFRLIGECREIGADPQLWRAHLLDGLRKLTGAQLGLYMHIRDLGTEAEEITDSLDAGFLDTAQRALWVHYQRDNAQRDNPFHRNYYAGFSGVLRTRRLAAVIDPREWSLSRHYNDYVRACGLEDRITSSVQLPGTSDSAIQMIVLHRGAGDGDYPARSVALVRMIHEELIPLLGHKLVLPPAGPPPPLPYQLEQVLACALEGDAEKQIALRLRISRHTVNRHLQRLYHHFGVHSRSELMFVCRDRLVRHRPGG